MAVQEPVKATVRVADVLASFGFDLQLLGSEKYLLGKLEGLTQEQTSTLKQVLMKTKHPRIAKEFSGTHAMCPTADQQTTK